MAPFWGLRGSRLHFAIWVEACFCVMTFGYNQSSAGGVLSDSTFNLQFPRMNTLSTTGSLQKENSRIQGELPQAMTRATQLTASRNGRRAIHTLWSFRSTGLHLSWRHFRSPKNNISCQRGSRRRCHTTMLIVRVRTVHRRANCVGSWHWRHHFDSLGLAIRSFKGGESW